ncbi:hypothetical protein NLG97_g966 [Lecanicillium saksenae]|uniref:Uncharacterized protein n=1 Tax=Lecanicillium saksenae TaxID=468837 RepID=A0ACC1R6H7_9HYPO|nr:hypothetical protein NLG97_g966 [Lecanicillium saksenae]
MRLLLHFYSSVIPPATWQNLRPTRLMAAWQSKEQAAEPRPRYKPGLAIATFFPHAAFCEKRGHHTPLKKIQWVMALNDWAFGRKPHKAHKPTGRGPVLCPPAGSIPVTSAESHLNLAKWAAEVHRAVVDSWALLAL